MQARLLCIESKTGGQATFTAALRRKGYQVELVTTGAAALEAIDATPPDVLVINAASLRTSGARMCQSLRERLPNLPIVLILDGGREAPKDVPVNVVLNLPFTVRKLDNRIRPFIPVESDKILRAGPIRLDLEHLQVQCHGKEARLTPRMAHLLEMLMRHPGEVINRDQLFREVWETDFTEDTRTLDVHISWLRRAIEENPRRPRHLKTLRGVGYRLDV